MKSRRRRFAYEGTEHIYKNTKDGGLLFYTLSDYLVFFTITCVTAEKMDITLAALTLMRDHVHEELEVSHPKIMADYERIVNAWYAQEFNHSCGRTGQLFTHPYGNAPKRTESKIRDSFAYLGNNPVERKLCRRAIEYRWNFLAYAHSAHPFSKPLVIRDASKSLRRAVKVVQSLHKQRNILNYAVLKRLFEPLCPEEIQQLTDFIISTYNVIDYEAAASWYGSVDKMIAAFDVNTGSEYDTRETFVGKDDKVYDRLASLILRKWPLRSIKDIITWPSNRKLEVLDELYRETGINYTQIAKFLHFKVSKTR